MAASFFKKYVVNILDRYYYFFLVGLVIICLGAGYFFLIKDKVAEIQKVGIVDLQSRQELHDSKLQTKNSLAALENQYQEVSQYQLKQLANVLPSQNELPALIIEVKNFILRNNLQLVSIDAGTLTPIEVEPSGLVQEMNISLSLAGVESYQGLKFFLDSLSSTLPLLELTSLSYVDGTDAYTLNLTTYFQ